MHASVVGHEARKSSIDFGPLGLVMIEVKYRSRNDRQDGKPEPWSKYVDDSAALADPAAARASGRFELARTWRLGHELARGRPLALVNLVARHETGAERKRTDDLERSLRRVDERRFRPLTLPDLLATLSAPWPP